MKEENKSMCKKVAGVIGAVLIGGISGASMVAYTVDPVIQTETVIKEVIKEVPVEVLITEQIVNTIEVEKIIEVDNGNLDLVLDYIYDNDGSVEYVINDLDDDELNMIVDRIVFTNEVKTLAYDGVKKDIIDELDEMEINNMSLEDDDIERLKVYDDVVINEIDYDDMDAEVLVEFRFEQEEIKYKGTAIARIRDGEYDELKDVQIELRL